MKTDQKYCALKEEGACDRCTPECDYSIMLKERLRRPFDELVIYKEQELINVERI